MTLLKTILQVPTKPQLGVMTLDISERETHTLSAIVTENEIEDGSITSDHRKKNPRSVTIDGFISEFPVGLFGLPGISATALQAKILGSEGLVAGVRKKPADAFKYLEELFDDGETFQMITSLKTYQNMVFEELSVPRTVKNGRSLAFTAKLKQITVTFTGTTDAFKLDITANAAGKKGLGKQSTKESTTASKDKGSLLLQGFQKLGVL